MTPQPIKFELKPEQVKFLRYVLSVGIYEMGPTPSDDDKDGYEYVVNNAKELLLIFKKP
jgi:hypothetical protein